MSQIQYPPLRERIATDAGTSRPWTMWFQEIKTFIDRLQFPVGYVLLTVTSTNPAIDLGYGSWSRICEGQFIVGQKTGDADFGTVGTTGGAKTHTHSDHANHVHSGPAAHATTTSTSIGTGVTFQDAAAAAHGNTGDNTTTLTHAASSNLVPFRVVYVWVRTA